MSIDNPDNLNLTQLSSADVHPQVRENFLQLKTWSKQITSIVSQLAKRSTNPGSATGGGSSGGGSTPSSTTIAVQHNGAVVGDEPAINFVDSADATFLAADSTVQGRVNLSVRNSRSFAFFVG